MGNESCQLEKVNMVSCAVSICKNTSGKLSKNKNGITFHRFPRDEVRRRQWEIAINREEHWTSTTSSAICSDHFHASNFYLTVSGLRRLSLEAVPIINISPCQQPEPTITQTEPADVKSTDTEEIINLKYKVRRLEVIAVNRKKRIQQMWQSKQRLRKKLEKMKAIIRHLIKVKKEGNI